METNRNKTTFACSRPMLATELIEAGYSAETKVSPWNQKRTLWVFELDEKAVDIIRRHYIRANKPLPRVVSDFLKTRVTVGVNQIEVR